MMIYIAAEKPSEKATHIKVSVRHLCKTVSLTVDPVEIKDGFIIQMFNMRRGRKSSVKLADMPRLAPKKLKEMSSKIKLEVLTRNLESEVWGMIRDAALEGGISIPETGVMNWREA